MGTNIENCTLLQLEKGHFRPEKGTPGTPCTPLDPPMNPNTSSYDDLNPNPSLTRMTPKKNQVQTAILPYLTTQDSISQSQWFL
jgi:hypothetical protein